MKNIPLIALILTIITITGTAWYITYKQEKVNIIDKQLSLNDLFAAIREVETGGELYPAVARSNSGALGPYQITYAYWQDAVKQDPTLEKYGYQAVVDKTYAEDVMLAYWKRYSVSGTFEELARIHNGGPYGMQKEATLDYWYKVKAKLKG